MKLKCKRCHTFIEPCSKPDGKCIQVGCKGWLHKRPRNAPMQHLCLVVIGPYGDWGDDVAEPDPLAQAVLSAL